MAPIHTVRIVAGALQVEFRSEATPEERTAARAIVDAWTSDDWEGTAQERRLARIDKVVTLRGRRGVLVYMRDHWQAQGNAGKAAAFSAMIAELDAAVDALLPNT